VPAHCRVQLRQKKANIMKNIISSAVNYVKNLCAKKPAKWVAAKDKVLVPKGTKMQTAKKWGGRVAVAALVVYAIMPALGALSFHAAYDGGAVEAVEYAIPEFLGGHTQVEKAVYKTLKGVDYHYDRANDLDLSKREALAAAKAAYTLQEKPNPAERAAGFLKFW